MKKSSASNREHLLCTWAKLISDCNEARASGITVKDWLKQNNISHDTYYHWRREVKIAYQGASCQEASEIVPVSNELITASSMPDTTPALPSVHIPSSGSLIRLTIGDVVVEISELSDPMLLTNVIKAVRYA